MSAGMHSLSRLPDSPDVLGELLHSLSQPLTSLRCSLELSIDEVAEQQQESVSAALEQTQKVISMIQLMREYLDAEQPPSGTFSTALAPVLHKVVDDWSSIAAMRGVRLCLIGVCSAVLPAPEARLLMALQYLIASMIEAQPDGGRIMLLLGEGPTGAVLRAEGEPSPMADRTDSTAAIENGNLLLRRVRLAIASRVFDASGAALTIINLDDNSAPSVAMGFVLRVPASLCTALL